MIDAQPGDDGWIVPLAVAAALFDDPEAAETAYRATEPLAERARRCPPRTTAVAPTPPASGWPTPSCARPPSPVSRPPWRRCPRSARRRRSRRPSRTSPTRYVAPGPLPRRRPAATACAASTPARTERRTLAHGPTSPRRTPTADAADAEPAPGRGHRPHRAALARARPRPGDRTHAADRLRRRARPDRPALAADVAAGVGPRPHRQPGGAVAAARRPAAGPALRPDIDDALRRLRAPARRPARRCRCCRPAEARAYAAEVRGRVLDVLDAPTPLPSGTRAARRRLRLRHDRPARAAARRDDAGHPSAPRGPGRPDRARRRRPAPADAARLPPKSWSPAARSPWAPPREPWALDNERPAHQRRGRPPSASTPCRSPTAPTRPSSRTAATTTRAGGRRTGWAHIREARPRGPAVLARATGEQLAAPPLRPYSSPCRRTSRCCTCAGTRPTPTPAGPAGGCPPRRSGRRPPATTRPTGRSRRYPWGDARPRRPSTPTSASATCGPPRPAATRPAPPRYGVRQLIGDVWEWTVERLPRRTRASRPSRTRSTRRCSSAPTTRCCAAARSAVDQVACRGTFRNWDYPIRRQIFSGFRTARDRSPGRAG